MDYSPRTIECCYFNVDKDSKKGDTGIDKEDIVSLRFSFNVHIDSLFSFVEKQNDKNAIKLPSTVLSTIIGDAYATGRVLLSLKLADTS